MAEYICTWFYGDSKEEESLYAQAGSNSSEDTFQAIYWRCIVVFFLSSLRFNKNKKHVLFTNSNSFPIIDGTDIKALLEKLGVECIKVDFNYKTPKGYYHAWQNQFFEFSILEYIIAHKPDEDFYLILDSDCVFLKPFDFSFFEEQGYATYYDKFPDNFVCNGLTMKNLQHLFEELSGNKLPQEPIYHAGEFLLLKVREMKKIAHEFVLLWPELMRRFEKGLPKFNEEAHTLSYLYYRNNYVAGQANGLIKQIWTDPFVYRNTNKQDEQLVIWHVPAEKKFGFRNLYNKLATQPLKLESMTDNQILHFFGKELCVTTIPFKRRYGFIWRSFRSKIYKLLKGI